MYALFYGARAYIQVHFELRCFSFPRSIDRNDGRTCLHGCLTSSSVVQYRHIARLRIQMPGILPVSVLLAHTVPLIYTGGTILFLEMRGIYQRCYDKINYWRFLGPKSISFSFSSAVSGDMGTNIITPKAYI